MTKPEEFSKVAIVALIIQDVYDDSEEDLKIRGSISTFKDVTIDGKKEFDSIKQYEDWISKLKNDIANE